METSTFALKDEKDIDGNPEDMEFNGVRGPGHRVAKSYWYWQAAMRLFSLVHTLFRRCRKNIKPEDDPVDWMVYHEARDVFLRNMQEHLLWSPPMAYTYQRRVASPGRS